MPRSGCGGERARHKYADVPSAKRCAHSRGHAMRGCWEIRSLLQSRLRLPPEAPRSPPWTRSPASRPSSAPRTSTRATIGGGRCRHLAPWGSISRSASTTGDCIAIGSGASSGAGEVRARRAPGLRRQQHPLHHLDQDRRMGARQALPFRAAHPHQQRSDPLGLRLGGRASQALRALAQAGELQGRAHRHARHRGAGFRPDGAARRGDRVAHSRGRRRQHAGRRRSDRAADDVRIAESAA